MITIVEDSSIKYLYIPTYECTNDKPSDLCNCIAVK